MCTIATLEARAPEFVGDSRAQTFIDEALLLHDSEHWGNAFCIAMAYYAAHCLTVLPADGTAPAGLTGAPITSIGTGGMSVGYGSASGPGMLPEDQALMTTVYGRKYLQIRSTRVSVSASFVTL